MNKERVITIVSLVFFTPYILGFIFPDPFWATHYLAFLPKPISIVFIIAAILLIGFIRIKKSIAFDLNRSVILIISLLFGALFYYFPIVYDLYGDAYKYWDLRNEVSVFTPEMSKELFSFKFEPSSGRKTILLLINWCSATFNSPLYIVFKWFNTIAGVFFIYSWISFIKSYVVRRPFQILLVIAIIFAPLIQFYFNHLETYAIVYLFLSWWVMIALKYSRSLQNKWLIILILLTLINITIHPTALLLIPTLILLVLVRSNNLKENLKWKHVLKWLFIPKLLIGAIVYFFVFKDYNDLRYLDDGIKDVDRLFLPLVNPPAPLDRYSMFSLNHLFDYFWLIFQWSNCIWLIIISVIIYKRRAINWGNINLIITTELLLTYIIFFFVLNPLLSMPMDVDLFSIPAIILFAFTLSLLNATNGTIKLSKLPVSLVLLAIINVAVVVVNSNKTMLSYRYQNTNEYVFKTYYLHANHKILLALSMLNDEEEYIRRSDDVIRSLQPYANKGNDIGFANLLMDNAIYHLDRKEYLKANKIAYKAYSYQKSLKENIKTLLITSHYLQEYKKAYEYALTLNHYQYPNAKIAGKVLIQMALENNDRYNAIIHSRAFLKLFPEDPFVTKLLKNLQEDSAINEVKKMFINDRRN